MIQTRILQNAADFDSVRGLWRRLAQNEDATIFQSFCWNRLAACCFAGQEQPYVICCQSDSGAALIPAAILGDGSAGLLGEKLFDYRDILYAGDETVLRHAWQQLCALNRPFHLTALRGERSLRRWRRSEPLPFAQAPIVRGRDIGRACSSGPVPEPLRSFSPNDSVVDSNAEVFPGECAPVIHADAFAPSESPGARFLQMHIRLGRYARRLTREGVMFKRRSGAERELVRFIYEAKAKQATATENLFRDRTRQEFMVCLAAEKESRCDIFTYESAGDLVAALVTFRDDVVRHCYTIYYDPRWADFSPGQLLLFEVAARSLAEGLDCDFMTGEYPYKNRLATARVPLFTVEIASAALPGVFADAEFAPVPAAALPAPGDEDKVAARRAL